MERGQERELELELKVLADVWFGMASPSVGNRPLLSVITSSQTKDWGLIISQPSFQIWEWFGRHQVNPLQSQTFLD